MFHLQAFDGVTIASIFHFGELFGEFYLLISPLAGLYASQA